MGRRTGRDWDGKKVVALAFIDVSAGFDCGDRGNRWGKVCNASRNPARRSTRTQHVERIH